MYDIISHEMGSSAKSKIGWKEIKKPILTMTSKGTLQNQTTQMGCREGGGG